MMQKILYALIAVAVMLSGCGKDDETKTTGSVRGIVTNAVTGEPINIAAVTLLSGYGPVITGSDGSYEIKHVEQGHYTVQVSSNGYQTYRKDIAVKVGDPMQCDIPMIPGNSNLQINNPSAYFGLNSTSQTVTIRNAGTDALDWSVSYSASWITGVSPMQGTILAGGAEALTIQIDRSKIPSNTETSTNISVTSNGGDANIYVSVNGSTNPGDASNVVSNGLYGYYTFEDNVKNIVEGAASGVGINSPTYVAGGPDGSKALSLSRSSKSYVTIGEGLIDKTQFSISFWVKGISDGHVFHVQTNANTASGRNNSFNLLLMSGKLCFVVSNYHFLYATNDFFSHQSITDNAWHMITLTSDYGITQYETATTKLYIDGVYTDVVSKTINAPNNDYGRGIKFVLGGEIAGVNEANAVSMQVDNLRIYNTRRLSDSEIRLIYQAELSY